MFDKDLPEFESKVMICCQLCNYKSNRKSNFERHMKSMHEECQRPFQCCGQVFTNKALLKNHSKQIHTDGYRCDYQSCNKVFPRKALLRRHQTVHNGIKEYSCSQCLYETSHKSNLERHCLRVHSLVVSCNAKNSKHCNQTNNEKIAFNVCQPNSSQTPSLSSTNSENELSSSLELVSESEKSVFNSLKTSYSSDVLDISDTTIGTNNFEDISDCLQIKCLEDMELTDDDLKCDNKKLRLCLRPYKCLICWLLFESQLEYFEHQLITDHMIQDSDQLDVIRAAAALTQLGRAKPRSFLNA